MTVRARAGARFPTLVVLPLVLGTLLLGAAANWTARHLPPTDRLPGLFRALPATGQSTPSASAAMAQAQPTPRPAATPTLVPLETASVARPVTLFPPDPAASGRWWMATRPAAVAGAPPEIGFWRRDARSAPWEWRTLESQHLREGSLAAPALPTPPPAPEELGVVVVERVVRLSGEVLGYWVWNAAHFVRLESGSHQWRPEWQWAPPARPFLLVPDEVTEEGSSGLI